MSEFYPSRRDALAGLLVSMAAPYVVRNSGLPMPVRDRTILSANELEWQTILGTRNYKKYPLTFAEVKAWRRSTNERLDRVVMVSWTGEGWPGFTGWPRQRSVTRRWGCFRCIESSRQHGRDTRGCQWSSISSAPPCVSHSSGAS